ncbi:MAG: hypothetical protein SGPRY_000978, partial [Prymnesium sp.]
VCGNNNSIYGVQSSNRMPHMGSRAVGGVSIGNRQRKPTGSGRPGLPPAAPSQIKAHKLRLQQMQGQGSALPHQGSALPHVHTAPVR